MALNCKNPNATGASVLVEYSLACGDVDPKTLTFQRMGSMRGKDLTAAELGRMTKGFHYLICRLSGNEVFILLMNSFTEISQDLWTYCAGYWGIDELIEQSEHITELVEQGRGLEAQVYITDKFDQYVRECGVNGAE